VGEKSFAEAKERAIKSGLDIILKTRSTQEPILQITPFRANLIKAFYEQQTKLKLEGNLDAKHR